MQRTRWRVTTTGASPPLHTPAKCYLLRCQSRKSIKSPICQFVEMNFRRISRYAADPDIRRKFQSADPVRHHGPRIPAIEAGNWACCIRERSMYSHMTLRAHRQPSARPPMLAVMQAPIPPSVRRTCASLHLPDVLACDLNPRTLTTCCCAQLELTTERCRC